MLAGEVVGRLAKEMQILGDLADPALVGTPESSGADQPGVSCPGGNRPVRGRHSITGLQQEEINEKRADKCDGTHHKQDNPYSFPGTSIAESRECPRGHSE
ncbi:hypothetical protein ACFORH_24425 [Amycolatopsis roodepoortensis]|uniref:Uncharacterized protein n=1 Tax=Amycolatopsis roodepoortensis TaxID=700274 RepID=A0ABR9LKM3_9PSEU|nr:hypothetical protein [Amycolatopsis roodepoortensis]MBE1581210.1 hypothetical protein [Amycolatopsis roodepoortensis]